LAFPEDAVRVDPCGGVLHRSWSEAAAVDPAADLSVEQARGFEDAQVLGDGRERDVERSGKFGDGSFAAGQTGEDGAPCRIGERPERRIERGVVASGGIVNHMV
jgi:hypothetical protein